MDCNLISNLVSGLIGSAIGSISTIWLTNKINKRGILVDFMYDSYKKIALSVQRLLTDPKNKKYADDLEEAVATVQFYGTPQQVHYVLKFLEEYRQLGQGDFNNLLTELRKEIRKELGLKEITEPINWFRIQRGVVTHNRDDKKMQARN